MDQNQHTTYKFLNERYSTRKTGRQKVPGIYGGVVVVLADPAKWLWDGLPEFSLGVLAGDTNRYYKSGETLALHFNATARLSDKTCIVSGSPCCLNTPVECLRYTGLEIEWEYKTETGASDYRWTPVFEFFQSLEEAEVKPKPVEAADFGSALVNGFKLSLTSFPDDFEYAEGGEIETVLKVTAAYGRLTPAELTVPANNPHPVEVLFKVQCFVPDSTNECRPAAYFRQQRYLFTPEGRPHSVNTLNAFRQQATKFLLSSGPVYSDGL